MVLFGTNLVGNISTRISEKHHIFLIGTFLMQIRCKNAHFIWQFSVLLQFRVFLQMFGSALLDKICSCYWCAHSWQFTENGTRRNIAQLWKLFLYITIRILKSSSRNCVSSLLSTHYKAFLSTYLFDLSKAQSL